MAEIINLNDHPGNRDPSARLQTSPRDPGGIYRTKRGFVVALPVGRAVDGFFEDFYTALAAYKEALKGDVE